MTTLAFALIALNTILMIKIFKSAYVHNFLKVLAGVSYYGWSATPLIITLTGYQSWIQNWNFYLYCAIIDQAFFFFTYYFFFRLVKKKKTPNLFVRNDFQQSRSFIRTLALIGFCSVLYLTYTKGNSDTTYLENNDLTLATGLEGITSYFSGIGIYFLIGIAIFQRKHFKRYELVAIYVALFAYYSQSILNGGRIYMFVFIIILWYYALESKKKTVLVGTVALSLFALSLLPIMAVLRGDGKMDVSEVAEGQAQSSSTDIIDQIYTKTNSVYYGSFVLQHDGIGGGGPLVYASTFLALVPRNILPAKPHPGSKDGTLYGLPSRLSAIYMTSGKYNDILNNGVPVSIESLWALGWGSYILQILVSAAVLFLFNSVFIGGKPFFLYCALSLINFPVCNLEISIVQVIVQFQRFAILYLILYLIWGLRKARR